MSREQRVRSRGELVEAAARAESGVLAVEGVISELPTLRLAPGVVIRGDEGAQLVFAPGQDGVALTRDNEVCGVELRTDPERRAILLDAGDGELGTLVLKRLRVSGCVRLLAEGARDGRILVEDVDVVAADARAFPERPAGFGVEVVPAAFTIWNRSTDPSSRIRAEVDGVRAGRAGAPVRGGGVFVGGTPGGGALEVGRLTTDEVHSDGGIAPGTPDRISGGVFVVQGARAREVVNRGPVTTYGPNDMVLDNWGEVETWLAREKITSLGPSGIGFVNFGDLRRLKVEAPIETHGLGARGFNVYAGSLDEAEFDRIVTYADGAVGVQISRPVGRIEVRRGIETFGATGDSLVKGVVTRLPATAFSVKPGGAAREVRILGGLRTHGEKVDAIELHGEVESFVVEGGFGPKGEGFEAI